MREALFRFGPLLVLLVAFAFAAGLALSPNKLYQLLSSLYGFDVTPPGPVWKKRLVGIVSIIWVSFFVIAYWHRAPIGSSDVNDLEGIRVLTSLLLQLAGVGIGVVTILVGATLVRSPERWMARFAGRDRPPRLLFKVIGVAFILGGGVFAAIAVRALW